MTTQHQLNFSSKISLQNTFTLITIVASILYSFDKVIEASIYSSISSMFVGQLDYSLINPSILVGIKFLCYFENISYIAISGISYFWVVWAVSSILGCLFKKPWKQKINPLFHPLIYNNLIRSFGFIAIIVYFIMCYRNSEILRDYLIFSILIFFSGAILYSLINAVSEIPSPSAVIAIISICLFILLIVYSLIVKTEPRIISKEFFDSGIQTKYSSNYHLLVDKSCLNYISDSTGIKVNPCQNNNQFCYTAIGNNRQLINYSSYISPAKLLILESGAHSAYIELGSCKQVTFVPYRLTKVTQ